MIRKLRIKFIAASMLSLALVLLAILGGINAGIPTVWVNPQHKSPTEIVPDYEIESITQLEALLETIG